MASGERLHGTTSTQVVVLGRPALQRRRKLRSRTRERRLEATWAAVGAREGITVWRKGPSPVLRPTRGEKKMDEKRMKAGEETLRVIDEMTKKKRSALEIVEGAFLEEDGEQEDDVEYSATDDGAAVAVRRKRLRSAKLR